MTIFSAKTASWGARVIIFTVTLDPVPDPIPVLFSDPVPI
jgi:hypothetical protein